MVDSFIRTFDISWFLIRSPPSKHRDYAEHSFYPWYYYSIPLRMFIPTIFIAYFLLANERLLQMNGTIRRRACTGVVIILPCCQVPGSIPFSIYKHASSKIEVSLSYQHLFQMISPSSNPVWLSPIQIRNADVHCFNSPIPFALSTNLHIVRIASSAHLYRYFLYHPLVHLWPACIYLLYAVQAQVPIQLLSADGVRTVPLSLLATFSYAALVLFFLNYTPIR